MPAKPYIRLPSSRGWILRQYPGTGMQAAWLGALFAAPGTAEFLAAAPQAGRLLRPLCRMLGIEPPPVIAPTPRPPRPKRPRPAQPSPGPSGKYPRLNPATYSPGRIPPPPRREKSA